MANIDEMVKVATQIRIMVTTHPASLLAPRRLTTVYP
jgi:hypothetical protein